LPDTFLPGTLVRVRESHTIGRPNLRAKCQG